MKRLILPLILFFSALMFAQTSQKWVNVKFDAQEPVLQLLKQAGVIISESQTADNGWMLEADYLRYRPAYALSVQAEEEKPFQPLRLAVTEMDTLGAILLMLQLPPTVQSAIGLGYLHGYLYLSDFSINNEVIYQLDVANNFQVQVTNIWPMPGSGTKNPWGVTAFNNALYIADGIQDLIFVTDSALNVHYSINTPGPLASGLGYHDKTLWNGDLGDFTSGIPEKMLVADTLGNLLRQYTTNISINGVTATDSIVIEGRNRFNGEIIIGRNPTNYAQLFSLPSPLEFPNGLAFDGQFLWIAGNHQGGRYIVKVGLGLSSPPEPLTAQIGLSADSLGFGMVYIDSTGTQELTISNSGDTTLVVDSIYTSGAVFAASVDMLAIPADSSATISVTFMPIAASPYTGTMTIVSNADSLPVVDIPLSGTGEVFVGIDDHQLLPKQHALRKNYPNPFNPQTTIRYQLAENSHVSIVIYNQAGQKITTLLNTRKSAGLHEIVWNGRNGEGQMLASGIYFYRMTAGKHFSATGKMLFLK